MPEMLERLEVALVGRYRVHRELGHGGMAVVFLATDLKHQRQVAIKVLKPELSYAIGTERFLREIGIAARLNHPHVLSLHDSGDAGGLLYYVMPYVEGESLRDRLDREKRLPADDAVRIASEVADALAYAHDQGLIHRDVKPENILLQAGHALVSDFGIARAVSAADGDRLTETGIAIGTPAYMSPEQSLGGRTLDGRSDVYSLGCVLYEMLSGTPPFDGPVQAIVAGHAVGVVPPLHAAAPGVPPNIEAAVHVALAKLPDDRFASPRAFAAALRGGDVRPAPQWRRIRLQRPLTVAALAGVLIAGSAVAWRKLVPAAAPRIRSLAVLPLENLSRDTSQEYLVAGIHEALIGELARISALRVISRTSTLAYRGGTRSVPEIARELSVDGVVEGTVLRRGDSVRIQVQLIRARPEERQVWSHAYKQNMSHVLALYRDVAQAVARQVQAEVTPSERARFASAGGSVDPAAYESYLKGKFHWQKLTPGDLDASFDYFQLALRQDSTYALAHSGIAEVWIARLQMGLLSPAAALPKASAAALRALELDSALVEGHHDLALIRTQTWDWRGAEAAFQRTFDLNPAFSESRAYYSHLLNILGHPARAREQMDQALVRDPLNPLFRSLDAVNRLFERRWDDAIEQARIALRAAPGHPVALIALFQALDRRDRQEEAVRAAAQYLESTAQPAAAAAMTRAYAAGGYRDALRSGAAALGASEASGYVTASDVALLYAVAGDNLMTLHWLERAYEVRDPNLPYLGLPCFDAVRGEPRFRALLLRMRLS